MGYKSYGQAKRDEFDYRYHYLKHNKGIFGKFYICSQCLKPMFKSGMEVDHIFPVSKWYAPNRVINCVAICPTCNKKKSAKVGLCSVKGIIAKIFEEIIILIQRIITLILSFILMGAMTLIHMFFNALVTRRCGLQYGLTMSLYAYLAYLGLSFIL